MTDPLQRNVLGKQVELPRDDVSQRAEQAAFIAGVDWVNRHLLVSADEIEKDHRDDVQVEGKPTYNVILKSGNPAFAKCLRDIVQLLGTEASNAARELYPDFDPLPPAMKRGESSGL